MMQSHPSLVALCLLSAASMVACERTVLETPNFGSCNKLDEPYNDWPWFTGEQRPDDSNIGFELGDTAQDFKLLDQFGNEVCLWQFTGKMVLVDASALWCEPCKDIAKHSACVADSFEGELVYLTFIGQNDATGPAVQGDNTFWADEYGLSDGSLTPVIADGTSVFVRPDWVTSFPSFMLLDRDMTIVAKGAGRPGETEMRDAAAEALGPPSDTCED